MTLKKLFPALLTTTTATYTYSLDSNEVRRQINSLFAKGGKFLSVPDFTGRFDSSQCFSFYVNSGTFTWGAFYGSTLYGQLYEEDNKTIVETTVKSSVFFKITAAILFLAGIGMFYNCVINFSFTDLLWVIGLLFLSPFLCDKFADVANGVVEDRYEDYINKLLGKVSAANGGLPKATNLVK
jgi:hypothetical protein